MMQHLGEVQRVAYIIASVRLHLWTSLQILYSIVVPREASAAYLTEEKKLR